MRVLFLVQSEGRGHLSQAIALASILRKYGIELSGVIVGKNSNRVLPAYFIKRIHAEIHQLNSFSFVYDSEKKGIRIWDTLIQNMRCFPAYLSSVRKLHEVIKDKKPDVIINFYEPLVALHFLMYPLCSIQRISVGHQYLTLHKNYIFPDGYFFNKLFFKLYTRFTALGSKKLLALSSDLFVDERKILVVPPILRSELSYYRQPESHPIILAYVVSPGFVSEIQELAKRFPEYHFLVFSDLPGENLVNLTHHLPDDRIFLYYLHRCEFYLSTAGFESVCEALYLQKKIFLVPVKGHFEQMSNAEEFSTLPCVFCGTSFLQFTPQLPFESLSTTHQNWLMNGGEILRKTLLPLLNQKKTQNLNIDAHLSGMPISE